MLSGSYWLGSLLPELSMVQVNLIMGILCNVHCSIILPHTIVMYSEFLFIILLLS